ncbi:MULTISPECIES: hypothetical protein [unclassified Leucobacter]|uniref:hypothetical protein n=1 Tax=unclassified Leucobacter TaxID=2621730 RepID=UPI00301B1229
MPRYRDPRAPVGRVVFGGVPFVDGVTADIEPGEGTLSLFASAGIAEVAADGVESTPEALSEPAPDQPDTEKPAPRRRK